jgi:hypothetical protein
LTTKTQACASARALVGAALTGSAMGLILLASNAASVDRVPDQTTLASSHDAGLRGSIHIAQAPATAKPQLVRASLLPEPPAALPASPIPYIQLSKPKVEATDRDLDCLTRAVYFESRGDSDVGQAAVAQVVLNRTRHPAFPKSVCAVVNQGVERRSCQFSFVCRPTKVTDQREWARAREVAERALDGHHVDGVGTSTFFHAARINPGWGSLQKVGRFGNHVFYRYAGKRGAPSAFTRETKPSLLDSFTAPIQAAFSKPAVETVTTPAPPILSFPKASATPAKPPVDDAVESGTNVTAPTPEPTVVAPPSEPLLLQPTASVPAAPSVPTPASVS